MTCATLVAPNQDHIDNDLIKPRTKELQCTIVGIGVGITRDCDL